MLLKIILDKNVHVQVMFIDCDAIVSVSLLRLYIKQYGTNKTKLEIEQKETIIYFV